jgi:Condensation domain
MTSKSVGRPAIALSPRKAELLSQIMKQQVGALQLAETAPRPQGQSTPLSFQQLESLNFPNNLSAAVVLKGPVDVEHLARCVERVYDRHDILRTHFQRNLEGWAQVVSRKGTLRASCQMVDGCGAPRERLDALLEDLQAQEQLPFDREQGPMIKSEIFTLAPDLHLLWIVVDHAIFDGWSLGVFARELVSYYNMDHIASQREVRQYGAYAYEQHSKSAGISERHRQVWLQQLSGLRALELGGALDSGQTGYQRGERHLQFGGHLSARTRAYALTSGATAFTVLLAAYNVFLRQFAATDDLPVIAPLANRNAPGLHEVIGKFAGSTIVRTTVGWDDCFDEVCASTASAVRAALGRSVAPIKKLLDELYPNGDPVCTSFSLENYPAPRVDFKEVQTEFARINFGRTTLPLGIVINEFGGPMQGLVVYDQRLWSEAEIDRLLRQFLRILDCGLAAPQTSVRELWETAARHERTDLQV